MSYISQNNAYKVIRVSSLPTTGELGALYLNTTTKVLWIYDGINGWITNIMFSDFVYDYYARYNDIPVGGYANKTRKLIVLLDETDSEITNSYESVNGILQKTLGKSAYQVAVDNGFSGSQTDWLVSIQGKVGKSLGAYDVATNTPTLTALPSSSFVDGDYYDLITSGSISFGGVNFTSGSQFFSQDQLKKVGNQWYRVPFAIGDGTLTYDKLNEQTRKTIVSNTQKVSKQNTKSSLVENRINNQFEDANLSSRTYISSGSTSSSTVTQIAQDSNLKLLNSNVSQDGHITLLDTNISTNQVTKVVINCKILSINTVNPSIGIGYGNIDNVIGFCARKNGTIVRTNNYISDTISNADTNLEFVINDIVQIELEPIPTGVSIVTKKGGVSSDTQISEPALNGTFFIVLRGSLDVEVSLDTYYNNEIVTSIDDRLTITEYNSQSNFKNIESINNIINNVQIINNYNKGVTNITLGTAMSGGKTRIDNLYQMNGTSTIVVEQIQIGVEVGGIGKIKFFSKSTGNVYDFEKEFSVNFIAGINTFGVETFGDNFQLPIGCFVGVYSSVASFSGILGSSGNSKFLNGDILHTDTFSDSDYVLQMKISYKDVLVTSVKQDIEDINTIIKYDTETDKLIGVNTITTGSSGGTSRTRIDKVNVITGSGTILLKQFQIGCQVAGSSKIKFFTKNLDGTFNLIKEFSATLSVGINTFGIETFGEFILFNNCYVGVYVSGLTEFSSVISPSNGVSGVIFTEANGSNINFGDSQHIIQYKLIYTDIVPKTLKQDVDILNKKVVYVSKLGSDSNIGDKVNPFLTIQKAINTLIGSNGKVIIGEGDYRETLNFSNYEFENIELFSEHNSIVRIMGSQQLTGWTKTSGYTNIYQCAFSGTIPSQTHPSTSAPRIIFEDFNPSKQILESERLPQQRGLNYRLQYTEIFEVTSGTDLASSLAILDSQVGFYLNSGVLYIHASNSTNPTSNGFSYEVPVRATNIIPSSTNKKTKSVISLNSIKFFFSKSGWISSGFGKIIRHNCSIMGVTDNYGGWRDDSCEVLSYFDRAGGCSNDGFNQHFDSYYSSYATLNNLISPPKQIYVDPWAHDNKDDGMSCHIWGNVTVFGGLSEYNGDGGFVPANGGSYTCYNCIARRNNWNSDSSQAGFATANPATGTGREATTLIGYNCISENNKYGFKTEGSDKNVMTLINPIGRFNTTKDYRIKTGIMNTYDAKVENSNSTLYLQVDGGAIHNKYTSNLL